MATPQEIRPTSLFSPQFITGVYLPTGLLLVGVGLTKPEWLPYAVAASLVLSTLKIYSTAPELIVPGKGSITAQNVTSPKALKPDQFQHFTLKEKNVLSHNTAMHASLIASL
ncbi:NADH-cytochrome b5 reductase [Puttea exsequens]|nr:NADH-cytochrome b5 reductase [Puttea exsequens]